MLRIRIKTLLILSIMLSKIFAVVPVIEQNSEIRENVALGAYTAQIQVFVNDLAQTTNTVTQLTALNGLIAMQQKVANLCIDICSPSDQKNIQQYLDSINTNIIGQFKNYADVANDSLNTLKNLTDFIAQFPENTKQIGIALQRASQETLTQMQASLLQIQTLMTLDAQKKQSEHQIEKANNDAVFNGFSKSGL